MSSTEVIPKFLFDSLHALGLNDIDNLNLVMQKAMIPSTCNTLNYLLYLLKSNLSYLPTHAYPVTHIFLLILTS